MNQHFIGTRRAVVALCLGLLVVALGALSASADTVTVDFESFALGTVDGQDGWQSDGAAGSGCALYDHAVVNNTFGFPSFGTRSLRISNAVTSGCFSDQTFSKSTIDEAGETSAANGGMSGGTRQDYFEAEWDFASTVPGSEQAGLSLTVSPDRGDGARMSWVQMADTPGGLEVNFYEYDQTADPGCATGGANGFVFTNLVSGLDRTVPHTIKLTMNFVDGADNDVVRVYVDGNLEVTGGSWEDYFRDCEGNPTRTVDSLLFRTGGAAASATAGLGFVIDNLSQFTGAEPCTTVCYADAVNGNDANGGTSPTDAKKTIQAAIDAVQAGGQVRVLPGSYSETAANRTVLASTPLTNGPHQFGLFFEDDTKDGVTLVGVTAADVAITDPSLTEAVINTNATNNFGYSGIFVEADNVTISGLEIGANIPWDNKTIEVIGDAFTFKNSFMNVAAGGSLYFGDWRFDTGTNTSYMLSYEIDNNIFSDGTSVDMTSGAGYSGATAGKKITNNQFEFTQAMYTASGNTSWPNVSFTGDTTTVPWFEYPMTGAVITGNTFSNMAPTGIHIRARGIADDSTFDWESYWNDNTFNKAVIVGPNLLSDVRAYSYTCGSYSCNDVRQIGAVIQPEIDHAVDGDTVMASAGVYQENVTVYKKITLDGAGSGSDPLVDTIIDPVTGVGINITSSGTSAADRLVIKDLRVTDAPADGITLSGTGGSYLTLDNVASVGHPGASSDGLELKSTTYVVTDVKIVNSNLSDNDNAGFRMGTQTKLDGLTMENTTINGNSSGVSVFTHTSAPTFNNITFTNVTISDNTNKGIYVERLNNATFSGLTVTGNGSAAAAFMAGVDINLKYADFNNITIEDSTFENNGLGDTGGSGVDLTIKARNDGSYASQPATLINLDVNHNTFGGASHVAMSVGNNLDEATTTINRNAIGGTNTVGLVVFGTLPATMINAECNWWDDASGPSGVGSGSGNAVTLNADYTPWLYTSDLDGPCFIGGTIKVTKVAAGGGNTQFGFDPSWSTTNFSLTDGGSQTSPMLQAGSYSVAEVTPLPTGWTLQSATCDNSATTPVETAAPSAITLADGDAWVCTFTNVYTPPPTNICSVGTASSLWTDIIGKGMGNPKKHKNQVKLTIPNYAQVDSLYGQMVAKNSGAANYVRFILPGKNNWVQVNTITSPADHNAGNFWYGEYINPAKTVTGRWFLQKSGAKNHIPRALVLYPTYESTTNTYVNIWNTYDAAEGEAYWDTANGWTQQRVITESIAPPNGPTTFNVELAVADNDKDARPIWVTVEAGGVTQTQMPNNPSDADQLNLMTFTLANVPAGTDEITITIYSPSMAADGVIGDSAALVGMRANYMCAPLN